jgi:hypothetical protein
MYVILFSSDLDKYYNNLAVVSDLTISIKHNMTKNMPCEDDLKIKADDEPVELRNMKQGFYFLDTTDWEEGIYDVWFTLNLAENKYISPTNQIQIYL